MKEESESLKSQGMLMINVANNYFKKKVIGSFVITELS
jgi:hypothetical protein